MEPTVVLAKAPLFLAPLALIAGALFLLAWPTRRAGVVSGSLLRGLSLAACLVALLPIAAAAPAALRGWLVLDRAARVFRLGSLDVLLGLSLDKVGFALALCALSVLALSLLRASSKRGAATLLFVGAGALTALLAEGVPTSLLAIALSFWAAELSSDDAKHGGLRVAAFTTFLVAVSLTTALTFWALGGQWLDDTRYFADYKPRFVVDAPATAPKKIRTPNASGKLTVLSHPGARVYLGVADDVQLERSVPLGETPLVDAPVPAGLQKVAIEPGGAAVVGGEGVEVALLDVVDIEEGKASRVKLVGPTVTYAERALAVADPAFAARRLGRFTVGPWIAGLAGVALFALLLAQARRASEACSPLWLLACAGLAASLGPLVTLSSTATLSAGLSISLVVVYFVRRDADLMLAMAGLPVLLALTGSEQTAPIAAAGLAFGLVALTPARGAVPAAASSKVANEARGSERKGKRKGKSRTDPQDEDASSSPAPTDDRARLRLALGGGRVPLLGAFAAVGAGVATAVSRSTSVGALMAAVLAVGWAALAWAATKQLARGPIATDVWTRVAVVLAVLVAPVLVIALGAFQVSRALGVVLACLIALVCALPAAAAVELARRDKRVESLPSSLPLELHAKVLRVAALAAAALSLPLTLVGLASERARSSQRGDK